MIGVAGLVALAVGLLMFPLGSACGETCPTPEQLAYFDKQHDAMSRFLAANSESIVVMRELDTSQELFYDEGWRRRLKRSLDEENFALEERKHFKAPPGTERVHNVFVRISDMHIEANEMLWEGILADDPNTINQSTAIRTEATRLTGELETLLEIFCE